MTATLCTVNYCLDAEGAGMGKTPLFSRAHLRLYVFVSPTVHGVMLFFFSTSIIVREREGCGFGGWGVGG